MNRIMLKYSSLFLVFFLFFLILGLLFPAGATHPLEAVLAVPAMRPKESLTRGGSLPLALGAAYPENPPAAPISTPTPPPGVYEAEPTMAGDTLIIKNNTPYSVDVNALLKTPLTFSEGVPTVLILHTHTSEAYTPSAAFTYTPSDPYRTEDPAENICLVGAALAESLRKNGVKAVCDTTSHDYPSYSGCYNRSLATIEKNLQENPSIGVVIDLHRDALSAGDGTYLKTAATVDGKAAAQVLVIVGTDAGGLAHPTWQQNLSLGLCVQKDLCSLYPELARPLQLRTERFNGHVSPGALLIEIGSNANTMEEALVSAELLGISLSQTLHALAGG